MISEKNNVVEKWENLKLLDITPLMRLDAFSSYLNKSKIETLLFIEKLGYPKDAECIKLSAINLADSYKFRCSI